MNMREGQKSRRWKLFGFASAILLAGALWLPGDADAHWVDSGSAAAALASSHYGGLCGQGTFTSCSWVNPAYCYYGGDGHCRVGDHSLQLEGSYEELENQINPRTCSGVYRMYHLEFGGAYWDNCH
jgi:hypothetical protein